MKRNFQSKKTRVSTHGMPILIVTVVGLKSMNFDRSKPRSLDDDLDDVVFSVDVSGGGEPL